MKKYLLEIFFLLISSIFLFSLTFSCFAKPALAQTPSSGGVLLFKSGFESATYLSSTSTPKPFPTPFTGNIYGTDNSVTGVNNNWNNLSQIFPWAKYQTLYSEGGSWKIDADPVNPNNKVLHFHNGSSYSGISRTQYTLKSVSSWTDDGTPNLFDKQFYRVRMFIPTATSYAYEPDKDTYFYMIWESHAWPQFIDGENTRYAAYIKKFANNNYWHFRAEIQNPEGETACRTNFCWSNCTANPQWCDANHQVPFGKWFTFDVYFKYAATDGEFYVAYQEDGKPRQTVARFQGKTKYNQKIHDQQIFKMYHDQFFLTKVPGGTDQYYDDVEIWSDYPPGYWDTPGSTPTPSPSALPTATPTPAPTPMTESDYYIWLANYNKSLQGPGNGDFNNSGQVDGVDYIIWLNHVL